MRRITLLTWDGGGNVTVTVAIAVALRARGHAVTILGPRSLRRSVESEELRYADLGILPPRDPGQRLGYLLDVIQGTDSMLERLRRLAQDVDAVVIDCNLSWALRSRVAPRTAVLVHTALGIYLPVWQSVLDLANAQRTARGVPPLAAAADAWARSDRLLVASIPQFDRASPGGLHPTYVGPVRGSPHQRAGLPAIPPAGGRPRVLISYSTDGLQNSPHRVQTALDALADLPVAVVATTSGAFATTGLCVPTNATLIDWLPHDSVMAAVAVVVCHAGHGTTMAALTHGVPLVCVPRPGARPRTDRGASRRARPWDRSGT